MPRGRLESWKDGLPISGDSVFECTEQALLLDIPPAGTKRTWQGVRRSPLVRVERVVSRAGEAVLS